MATPDPPPVYYAPAVTSGPFSFHPSTGLQVTLPDPPSQSFSRASSRDLYKLLTYTPPTGPELTKTGKVKAVQPGIVKDQTAAFYQAQLIHYGLKPLKTKEAAKKALLKAFEGAEGTNLKVPKEVAKEEKDLKARYLVANVVAKKEQEAKAKKGGAPTMAPVQAPKPVVQPKVAKPVVPKAPAAPPKREPSLPNIIQQGSSTGPNKTPSSSQTQSQSQGNFKGRMNESGVILCQCDKPAILLETKKIGKNTGRWFYKCDQRTKCTLFLWEDESRQLQFNPTPAAIPSFARQQHALPNFDEAKPKPKPAPKPRTKQTARKRGGLSPTMNRDQGWDEDDDWGWDGPVGAWEGERAYPTFDYLEEMPEDYHRKRKNEEMEASGSGSGGGMGVGDSNGNANGGGKKVKSAKPGGGQLISIADEYSFSQHGCAEEWTQHDISSFTLSLGISKTGHHLWGSFDFGVIEGFIRSHTPLPLLSSSGEGVTIVFLWRGRDTGTGESQFDSDQTLTITFKSFSNDRWEIVCDVECMGMQKFWGRGRGTEGGSKREVKEWKDGYYQLTMRNHDRESVSRWGGWGGDSEEEREANSDSD